MRTFAAIAGALTVAGALAQQQSGGPQGRARRGAADGGTTRDGGRTRDGGPSRRRPPGPVLLGTDPPGKLRDAEADAGASAQDAGPTAVQLEVQQLRARVDALEREQVQARQQSQQMEEVVRQLQQMRAEMTDAESRRQAAEQDQAARRDQVQSAISAVYQAQSMLTYGDSAVDDQLAQAQSSFPPQAQREVQAAREALRNRDLSLARTLLSRAIADAQQGR